jgi:hypothetical protein
VSFHDAEHYVFPDNHGVVRFSVTREWLGAV